MPQRMQDSGHKQGETQTNFDKLYNAALANLKLMVDENSEQFSTYTARLDQIKEAVRNPDGSYGGESFCSLAYVLLRHVRMKEDINYQFADDDKTRSQLLYDLGKTWKEWGEDVYNNAGVYTDMLAEMSKAWKARGFAGYSGSVDIDWSLE